MVARQHAANVSLGQCTYTKLSTVCELPDFGATLEQKVCCRPDQCSNAGRFMTTEKHPNRVLQDYSEITWGNDMKLAKAINS